jgi:hypothetical protein
MVALAEPKTWPNTTARTASPRCSHPRKPENPYPRFSRVRSGLRFYKPETGTWISRDPIEERGGVNLYGFVHGDPVSNVDPDGRFIPMAIAQSIRGRTLAETCCCCCAEDIEFEKPDPDHRFRSLHGWDPSKIRAGYPYLQVFDVGLAEHLFTAIPKYSYHRLKSREKQGHCTLQWLETVRYEGPSGWGRDTTDVDAAQNPTQVRRIWSNRLIYCPANEIRVSIPDEPGMWTKRFLIWPPGQGSQSIMRRTETKDLTITIILKSAADCSCTQAEKRREVKQHMVIQNGLPIWGSSSLTSRLL